MLRTLLAACLLLPIAAHAEDRPILAEYWTNNGSLPPEYAWEASLTIYEDGRLELTRCTGYETSGPGCKTRRATVKEPELQAIRDAARASGLLETPARATDAVTVGGGLTGGLVYLDGQKIILLSEPVPEDAERVALVLQAIVAAVPNRLDRFLEDD